VLFDLSEENTIVFSDKPSKKDRKYRFVQVSIDTVRFFVKLNMNPRDFEEQSPIGAQFSVIRMPNSASVFKVLPWPIGQNLSKGVLQCSTRVLQESSKGPDRDLYWVPRSPRLGLPLGSRTENFRAVPDWAIGLVPPANGLSPFPNS